ncbi:MAG: hypothetical protein IJA87_07510 [Clostridia bacterium]|nr:hypothetical protein [Clostridia bacterium]
MHDDSDIKIFKAPTADSDTSDLFAVAEEIKRNILNGNSAKAKALGKELASLSPESEDLINELTETLDAEIKNQCRLLMVFSAEYTLLSELKPILATAANESLYNGLKKDAPEFYDSISNGAAMSFYYLAVKQRDVIKAVGENFAMLCNAKGNEAVSELGSKIFLTTCKHVVGVVEKYAFEK